MSDVGMAAGARVYARMTLLRLKRGRVAWACGALLVLPLVYTAGLALAGHWGRGLFDDVCELYFRFLIPFVPALLASPIIAEEIENKTFTFVFARPAPRSALVVGKFAAAIGPLVALLVPTLALAWVIALARFPGDFADGWTHLLRVEAAAVLGLVAFAALAVALGTVFSRHPFVGMVGYLLLIEAGLGSSPVVLNLLAITWHLRNLADLPLPASDFMALHVPAWGSALVAMIAAPGLLALAVLGVSGAEYRTDR
jgi:ABC-type transport system involved in multi-copper enzyme maturation permease subunit